MSSKRSVLYSLSAAMLITAVLMLLHPVTGTSAASGYIPPAQAGEIIEVDGVRYQVLWRGEGKRSVLIYDYPNVKQKTVTLPTTVNDGNYEWKVIGALSGAFKNCITPKTFVIDRDTNIDWYYMCPDAFINGAKQTIKVYPADGEWNTLYLILEINGPKPNFLAYEKLADALRSAGKDVPFGSYELTTNTEDTLYVVVPKGTYTLDNKNNPGNGAELRVYSNTTLELKGVTFKRGIKAEALKKHMLSLGTTGLTLPNGTMNGKYNAGSNIKIIGGTFDNGTLAGANNIVRGSHLSNITIKNTVFKYLPSAPLEEGMTNSHCIEIAGVKKFTITGCKFYNNENCFFNNEAVQIESCGSDPTAKAHTNIAAPLDDTQTSNVTITKCYFEGFNYGCGSNHLSVNDCYKNMKFTKNTFIGCKKYCVCLYSYDGVTVTGNKMKDCAALILDPSDHKSSNITDKSNTTIE